MAQYSKIANGTWREEADIIPRAEFDASVGGREDRDAFAARGRSDSNCNLIGPGRPEAVPSSMAIAGIYGYIGQLIYNAALELGVPRIYGFDPGPRPADFCYSDRLDDASPAKSSSTSSTPISSTSRPIPTCVRASTDCSSGDDISTSKNRWPTRRIPTSAAG